MELTTALAIFRKLEELCYEDGGPFKLPIFDMRLDAGSDRNDERAYRVRVTLGTVDRATEKTWRKVLDVIAEHSEDELSVGIANNGIEID